MPPHAFGFVAKRTYTARQCDVTVAGLYGLRISKPLGGFRRRVTLSAANLVRGRNQQGTEEVLRDITKTLGAHNRTRKNQDWRNECKL